MVALADPAIANPYWLDVPDATHDATWGIPRTRGTTPTSSPAQLVPDAALAHAIDARATANAPD